MSHLFTDVDGICHVDHEVGDKTPVELRFVAGEGKHERDVQHTRCNTRHHHSIRLRSYWQSRGSYDSKPTKPQGCCPWPWSLVVVLDPGLGVDGQASSSCKAVVRTMMQVNREDQHLAHSPWNQLTEWENILLRYRLYRSLLARLMQNFIRIR